MYKYRLLTPGPVSVPERVRRAMAEGLVHHRAPDFPPLFLEVREKLQRVYQTEHEVLLLSSSGTGAMESAVANLLGRGDRAVVVRGGKFGERWAEICVAYGVEPVCVDVEWGRAVNPDDVRAAFEAAPDARALLVQASETSTGVYHPIHALAELVREQEDRLIIVDAISALGVHDLPMDRWDLDAVVSGAQKSWMLPPGLAFIGLSPRAQKALEHTDQPRYYFDLRKELEGQAKAQTAFTPAIAQIRGLREALDIMLEHGLPAWLARHEKMAKLVRGAVQALGLKLLAADSPSFATTAVFVPPGIDGAALVKRMRDTYGVHVAGGQGKLSGKIFRVGHMGDVDAFDMLTVIAALEMALADLGHPVELGEGTRTASRLMRELAEDER